MNTFAVIMPAAGASRRFGGGSKLLAPLGGEPVIRRSVRAFSAHPDVACIVIPTSGNTDEVREALGDHFDASRVFFCEGGATRAHSVLSALEFLETGQLSSAQWVAVHDAARPLASTALIDAAFAGALLHGAAVPAMPVALTVKQANGPLPAPVERTVPRQSLWAMQTPQVMRRKSLLDALRDCPIPLEQVTDDAQALELKGEPVWLIPGEERNLKITTADDLQLAEMLLRAVR